MTDIIKENGAGTMKYRKERRGCYREIVSTISAALRRKGREREGRERESALSYGDIPN